MTASVDPPKRRSGRVSMRDTLRGSASLDGLPPLETPTSAALDDLVANPHNPRHGYDGEDLDQLAASMAEVGQLQPLAVVSREVWLRHYPDEVDALGAARWVVLTGNRRLAAAPAARLERLDITVKDRLAGADPQLSEATLVENLHRAALPPMLEAREVGGLVDRHGSQEAVAKRVAKSQGWVAQRLALLKLTPELQHNLDVGGMTVNEARTVASAPPGQQAQKLADLRADVVPDESELERPRRGRKPAPVDLDRIARDLRRKLTLDQRLRLRELLADDA